MKARAKLFQCWEDSTMTPFGFNPENPEDSNEPVDFAAMMEQMQQQIQEQFSKLGINGP